MKEPGQTYDDLLGELISLKQNYKQRIETGPNAYVVVFHDKDEMSAHERFSIRKVFDNYDSAEQASEDLKERYLASDLSVWIEDHEIESDWDETQTADA